jgi:hypothetical protein
VTATPQLLVQIIQRDVRQDRRQRRALRVPSTVGRLIPSAITPA